METSSKKRAFFTIDVERFIDTECVYKSKQPIKQTMLDGLDRYIEILDRHNIKATLFVLSDIVDEVKDKLKKYIKNGHKIALHGMRHVPPAMMHNDQFKEQISRAKEKLEKILGVPVIGYRAPCFSMDMEKLSILKKLGFRYDSSRMEFSASHYDSNMDMDGFESMGSGVFKKDGFFEFGISIQKIFGKNFPVSGGGYIRISSWIFAQLMLNKYFKNSDNYVFYLHPFELSKEKIPRIKNLNSRDQYYLNVGILSYPYKIEYVIKRLKQNGYDFCTFEDVLETADKQTE